MEEAHYSRVGYRDRSKVWGVANSAYSLLTKISEDSRDLRKEL